jgi:hypothetical protein
MGIIVSLAPKAIPFGARIALSRSFWVAVMVSSASSKLPVSMSIEIFYYL